MATTEVHKQHDTHGDAHNTGGSVALYFGIFVALLVLLFASVGVAYVKTESKSLFTLIGFTIASIKALLIILYFMHVRFGSKLTMVFAFGSFFFLLIMVGLTMNDYVTRQKVVHSEVYVSSPDEKGGEALGYTEPAMNYPGPTDTKYGK